MFENVGPYVATQIIFCCYIYIYCMYEYIFYYTLYTYRRYKKYKHVSYFRLFFFTAVQKKGSYSQRYLVKSYFVVVGLLINTFIHIHKHSIFFCIIDSTYVYSTYCSLIYTSTRLKCIK